MRYVTTVHIKLKTSTGMVDLRPGHTFMPRYPEAVKSLVAKGIVLPMNPYLDKNNTLRIPFESDPKYHWWAGGQNIADTLAELEVSPEVWKEYTSDPYPKKVH